MDTKYFRQALDEFNQQKNSWGKVMRYPPLTIGEVSLEELSKILQRAQELKDADKKHAE